MFSKETLSNLSVGKVLVAAWMFFTTVYFLLTLVVPHLVAEVQANLINNTVNSQLQTVFQKGQESGQMVGYQAAIGQLGQALGTQLEGGCREPVPVSFGSGITVNILSENCLQVLAQAAAQAPAPAPAQ